jgi:hypothetical protein
VTGTGGHLGGVMGWSMNQGFLLLRSGSILWVSACIMEEAVDDYRMRSMFRIIVAFWKC